MFNKPIHFKRYWEKTIVSCKLYILQMHNLQNTINVQCD